MGMGYPSLSIDPIVTICHLFRAKIVRERAAPPEPL